jgi:diguanylate cyclase (GGDEF)-like protein
MRVLIAEDDVTSRTLLRRVLEKWGYEVVVTADGATAWDVLRSADPPRIAVLDWMMPEMDGVEVCRRARALETRQPPYIILLTALGEKEHLVTGFEAGADDYVGKPYDPAELRARLEVGRRLVELNDELIEAQLRLEVQARTDVLTGLANRRAILERLEDELRRASREGGTLGVGMVDVDHFKRVNDEHGHAAGDVVLCEVARRMQHVLRPYDRVGRVGGEEFLVLVPRVTESELTQLMERIREAVGSAPLAAGDAEVVVTVSAGATVSGGEPAHALIARADEALYEAKARGRDRVVLFGAPPES